MDTTGKLAERLRVTVHVSLLQRKLKRLAVTFPSGAEGGLEEWLVDMANARGARVITRQVPTPWPEGTPDRTALPDEELVVGLCLLQCADHPQLLRLAAQLISRGKLDSDYLELVARRERTGMVLAELARQALRVQADNGPWQALARTFASERHPREPLVHWTRLAEPLPARGRGKPRGWRLVR